MVIEDGPEEICIQRLKDLLVRGTGRSHDLEMENVLHAREDYKGLIQEHYLIESEDSLHHLWTVADGTGSLYLLSDAGSTELLRVLEGHLSNYSADGSEDRLVYQPLGQGTVIEPGSDGFFSGIGSIKILREGGDLRIKMEKKSSQVHLIYHTEPRPYDISPYIMSRLNLLGFDGVPRLSGISYWKDRSNPVIWSRLLEYGEEPKTAFGPFLSDLSDILDRYIRTNDLKKPLFLLHLSRDMDRPSFESAFQLGVSLSEAQVYLSSGDDGKTVREDGSLGNRIMANFIPGSFDMSHLGTLLGLSSSYLKEVKRAIYRLSRGDNPIPQDRYSNSLAGKRPSKGRKNEAMIRKMRFYYNNMAAREVSIQAGFKELKGLIGGPVITGCMDCRLERVSRYSENWFLFENLDWYLHHDEDISPVKLPPLKDISMVLNSFMKARYLSSKRVFRTRARSMRTEPELLDIMYMEYNVSRKNYASMARDVGSQMRLNPRTPLRLVFDVSVLTTLWYERCFNSLIEGYNRGIELFSGDYLSAYPETTDTSRSISLMQILLSLSNMSRMFDEGSESTAGLELDLLNVLIR